MKKDIYKEITDQIISHLETGKIPWECPYVGSCAPRNLVSGKEYTGMNIFLLGMSMEINQYESPYFVTFKQAKKLGGSVKKGSKGFKIVFWNFKEYESEKSDGTTETKTRPFLRCYTVFNTEQTEGLDVPAVEKNSDGIEPRILADNILEGYKDMPEVVNKNDAVAFYSPIDDIINMPAPEFIKDTDSWYSTMFHETVHSTGHQSRLSRDGIIKIAARDRAVYSMEELIAEMGAGYLCAMAGIENTIKNSAAYIQGWIKYLKGQNNQSVLVKAAGRAQKAVNYIVSE